LNLGEYEVQLQDDYSRQFKAGRQFELEAVVTNASSGDVVDDSQASVEVFFENSSETLETQQIDNYRDGEFYNSRVTFPDAADTTYLMHVEVSQDGGSAVGSTSRIVDIAPQIRGEITEFYSANGCNTQSMPTSCEEGAQLDVEYNVTNSVAENVNLSVYGFNSSGDYIVETLNLTDQGGIFTGDVTVPDLNTSIYNKGMEFVFNATNNFRRHTDRRTVDLETFKIQDRSPPTTYIGQNYQMQIFLGKPYSLNDYSKERFDDITVNVTDSDNQVVEVFDEGDLSYSETQGVMEGSFVLDEDNPTGGYSLDVTANNTYGEEKTLSSGFSVRDVNATFDIETEQDWEVNRIEPQSFSIPVENLLETENELEYEVTELEDEITVTNDTLNLDALEEDAVGVDVELSELTDKEGEIRFMDSSTNYNHTVDIDLETPGCRIQVGDLCSETESVEGTASSTSEFTESIDLRYIGDQDGSVSYTSTVEGEIGQYISLENVNETSELSDTRDVDVEFSPETEGVFTGEAVFEIDNDDSDQLTVPITLDYVGDTTGEGGTESSLSVTVTPEEVNLGTVVDGESTSTTLEVQNNGNQEINSVTASSSSYTVSTGSTEIPAEESTNLELTFEQVGSSTGTVDLTMESSDSETTETVSISASPIQNYGERRSELRDRLRTLQDSTDGSDEELTEASTKISRIQTAWDAGNYEEAERLYTEVSNTLDSVETSDTGTGGADTPENQNPNQNQGGGLPVLPIIGVLVVVLLAGGFLIYTSYIPEEGDPLYSVLGEKQ
jgi:hypothetical protein